MVELFGNKNKIYDVIIIGAGHAGLAFSYFLKERSVDHLVMERGKIGESWRSKRWGSFKLNTPNWVNTLPGDDPVNSNEADKFNTAGGFVHILEQYVRKFDLPVCENCEVLNLTKAADLFAVTIGYQHMTDVLRCKKVIVASGVDDGELPSISNFIAPHIVQLHAKDYKDAAQLPAGAILVAGSGQSGTQIAEDLLDHQKTVFLSCSGVPSVPRRYRGKDIFYWLLELKALNMPTQLAIETGQIKSRQPQVSGVGNYGHSVSLNYLADKGVLLIGKIKSAQNKILEVDQNVSADLKLAYDVTNGITSKIDEFIDSNSLDFPKTEADFDIHLKWDLDIQPAQISQLDLDDNNIQSIIWATGFQSNLSWIDISLAKEGNQPNHINGRSPIHGLYYIGFPWLRTRKSGIIYGVKEDIEYLVDEVSDFS